MVLDEKDFTNIELLWALLYEKNKNSEGIKELDINKIVNNELKPTNKYLKEMKFSYRDRDDVLFNLYNLVGIGAAKEKIEDEGRVFYLTESGKDEFEFMLHVLQLEKEVKETKPITKTVSYVC